MKSIPVIFKIFLAGLFVYLFLFTLELKITLYDAYDYMIMAKYNAGFKTWYPFLEFLRPPLLPALLTPFAFLHHFGVSYETIFTIMHVFSLAISCGFILASYFLFRKGLRPEFAALGAFLLMIQPGFMAYSFETMADIPAGLLMIISVFIYLRYRMAKSNGQLILLCFVMALGVAMKYPMVLAPLVFVGAQMILSSIEGNWKQIIADRFYYAIGLLSAAMYVAISVISLLPIHGWTLANVSRAIEPYIDHLPTIKKTEESMITNASFLYAQMTAPLFILMCVGLALIWRRKNEFNIVMFMWLAVFLLITSVIGAHYEFRYLFPLVPACYFFCAFGMQELFDLTQKRWISEKYFPVGASIVFILLMVLPVIGLAREIKSLSDDFYKTDFQRRMAEAATRGGKYFWFGPMYAMYQDGASFHINDPFYKIYHFWFNGINFYSDAPPRRLLKNMSFENSKDVNEGDILIFNPVVGVLQSKYLPPPEQVPPLSIGKVKPILFTLASKTENQKVFIQNDNKITLNYKEDQAFSIEISNKTTLTPGYLIWFKIENLPHASDKQTLFHFKRGLIWHVVAEKEYFDKIQEIMLINFESEAFSFTN